MYFKSKKEVEALQRKFPRGTIIRLINMQGEETMPAGLIGEVFYVDDIGQIHLVWENKSTLALNVDKDTFEVVN